MQEQLSLFSISLQQPDPEPQVTIATIPGLCYVPDYINEIEHGRLLAQIDEQPWLNDLKLGYSITDLSTTTKRGG